MRNSYMSIEDFRKLEVGDKITIRSLDDLIQDFGDGDEINLPLVGWNEEMDKLCGEILTISRIGRNDDGDTCIVYFYDDESRRYWSFSNGAIEPSDFKPITQAEISEMWEKMILGENANNEK